MKRRGKTEPFRGPDGGIVPGSRAGIGYLPIGGVEQWVMIRGRDRANPPLIMLHGGPGFSETRLFRHYNAPLEDAFTVVYWDQRGSGKSYDADLPRSSMTVEQFVRDLDELVDEVCARLDQAKVTIFGHSWGTALGMLYAARRPERVAAYVGSGQVGDWPVAEAASYAYALEEAERQGNAGAVEGLRAIGPPPHSAEALWKQRTTLQNLEGRLSPPAMWELARIFLGSSEYSVLDLANLFRGFKFSLDAMWAEVSSMDLNELVPEVQVPVFLLLGRHDRWTPPGLSVAYLEALSAPAKEVVWFEESGHEPFADEPERFNASMVELVRPAVA